MQPKKKNSKKTVKNMKHARASLNSNASSPKKKIEKKTENEKKSNDSKTLLIAQEVKFARLLASNDKRIRDKVLKNLKKWLTVRSKSSFAFTEADFLRLWKGLFYCMWMSDKPLVQEDLAESLSNLVHCFNSKDTALLYTKCTLKSLATEWFGIDRYRIDKFEMLVRKIIRQTFVMCKNQSWNKQWVTGIGTVMEEILLDPKTCLGLNLHITDIYMEELAKVSEGEIPMNIVTEFIRPFVIHLACMTDQRQVKHVVKSIFRYLIFQSDVGMEYSEKFNAWREAGFPCTNIDEMQKVEVSDEEEDEDDEPEDDEDNKEQEDSVSKEKPLDPRAGRVDVEIPQIPFDAAEITNVLKENKFNKSSTTLTRKHISRLIDDFSKLTKGSMPFGIKELPLPETTRVNPYNAAEEFLNFEQEIYVDSGKNRKRKKNGDSTELNQGSCIINDTTTQEDKNTVVTRINNKRKKLTKKIVNEETNEKTKKIKKIKQSNGKNSFTNEEAKKITSVSNNKQKITKNEPIQNVEEKLQKSKKSKADGDISLSLKKKTKRLNVSEPLPSKKLKKSSKKLNNTVNDFTKDCITLSNGDSINGKSSTSNSWDIDIPSKISAPSTPVKKAIVKKDTPSKNIDSPAKKENVEALNSSVPWLTPVITRLEQQKTPSPKSVLKQAPQTDSAKKRVKIVLQRNTAQNTSEYIRQLRQSPAIPFDANRKPKAGVLKPSPLPSPVNPFYKKKMF